jgi:hypothetical protein
MTVIIVPAENVLRVLDEEDETFRQKQSFLRSLIEASDMSVIHRALRYYEDDARVCVPDAVCSLQMIRLAFLEQFDIEGEVCEARLHNETLKVLTVSHRRCSAWPYRRTERSSGPSGSSADPTTCTRRCFKSRCSC